VPVDSQGDAGSIRSAIRWGLLLAAVATFGFRLPRLVHEFRAWRGAIRLGDASGSWSCWPSAWWSFSFCARAARASH